MVDLCELLVRFMEYMGMGLGNNPLRSGQEYRFKNFGFKEDRCSALRSGIMKFWARSDLVLHREQENENAVSFFFLSKTGLSGFEITFTFQEKACDLVVTLNFPEEVIVPEDFDKQFMRENNIGIS